jgi:hypothetical protein
LVVASEVQFQLVRDESDAVRRGLVDNENVTLTEAFPMVCLESSLRGRAFVTSVLEASGADTYDFEILRRNWTGTLGEILETAQELGAASTWNTTSAT